MQCTVAVAKLHSLGFVVATVVEEAVAYSDVCVVVFVLLVAPIFVLGFLQDDPCWHTTLQRLSTPRREIDVQTNDSRFHLLPTWNFAHNF